MHFKNKFELYKKDCRKTWNTINEVLKSKNKKHMVNDKFTTYEGTSITDKNEIVEQFNKYFTNIGISLNSKLPKTGEDPIQHIKHNTASFFCAPTDPTEIINIVKSVNSSKSSGVDNNYRSVRCAKNYSPDCKPTSARIQQIITDWYCSR